MLVKPPHNAGTEQGGAAPACMVAELTKPMMRAAMYCEAPTCSTPFSVDLRHSKNASCAEYSSLMAARHRITALFTILLEC